jgi:hypothetical protein
MGGCCSSKGQCVPGTAQDECGFGMTGCKTCVDDAYGTACMPTGGCGCSTTADCQAAGSFGTCLATGICGCNVPADCPAGKTCDDMHRCM